MREKRIMLLGATFGTNNMGVSALTAGAIEAGLHMCPCARIVLLDYEHQPLFFQYDSSRGPKTVELLNMRFSKKLYLKNNIAILILLAVALKLAPLSIGRLISSRNRYLDEIRNAEIAMAISGGDSFSDIYGLRRLLYVSLPQILVQLMGQKIVLLPQTLGPFDGRIARALARLILKRAALVYSRDYAGLKEMGGFLGRHFAPLRFRFCYDVGFVVNPTRPEQMNLDGFTRKALNSAAVGLNVSGLLWMGGYTHTNQFGLRAEYRVLVEKLINYLIREKEATVLLIPHVFGQGGKSESDQTVCETLYRDLKPKYGERIYLARGRYDQSEIKYIIGLCDFFIGSRMHACIAALSQCIPTVPVAYSKKFIGVMETIGVESYVGDLRTMDESAIIGIVDRAWDDKDDIRRKLEKKMPEVRARVLNLFGEIAEAFGVKE